jgi:hypothetical protein
MFVCKPAPAAGQLVALLSILAIAVRFRSDVLSVVSGRTRTRDPDATQMRYASALSRACTQIDKLNEELYPNGRGN